MKKLFIFLLLSASFENFTVSKNVKNIARLNALRNTTRGCGCGGSSSSTSNASSAVSNNKPTKPKPKKQKKIKRNKSRANGKTQQVATITKQLGFLLQFLNNKDYNSQEIATLAFPQNLKFQQFAIQVFEAIKSLKA